MLNPGFRRGACSEWKLPLPPRLVVANPPWGLRLGGGGEEEGGPQLVGEDEGGEAGAEASWAELALFLRSQCGNADAVLLSVSFWRDRGPETAWVNRTAAAPRRAIRTPPGR